MQKIEKPWGYEVIWANTDNYVAKFLHINPNSRLSLQYHEKKEETLYVMAGDLTLQLGDGEPETVTGPGSIIHVKPGTVHRFGAKNSPVMLCEVSTPEMEDVVRLSDDYNREDK
jgi:quercetin dioxygenase-like cupin family protein